MMNEFLSLTLNPYGGAPGGNPGALGYARAVGAPETLPKEAADAYAAAMPVKAPPCGHAPPAALVGVGPGLRRLQQDRRQRSAGTADTASRT